MEVEYHLTEEDFIQFNVFHVKNTKIARRSLMINRIVGPIFFLIFGYFYSQVDGDLNLGIIATVIILSALWVILYPKYFAALVKRNTKKGLDNDNKQGLFGHHRLTMTDDGVFDSTSIGTTSTRWESILEFQEDQYNFYLYYGPTNAYIIPKRDIENVDDVRHYIQSKRK